MPTAATSRNQRPLLVIFLTVFIDLVGFGMIIPLSPFLAQKFGADSFQVGLLMAIFSACQFLFSPFWGRLSDRIGRRPVLLISLFGSAASHLAFGFAGSLSVLFAARAFAGVFGGNISTAMAYIADVTPANERSKGMGLIGAAFGLGFVCGPAIGGLIAIHNPEYVAYVASFICFANFLGALVYLKESIPADARANLPKRASRLASLIRTLKTPTLQSLLGVSFLTSFGLSTIEASLFLYVKDVFGWSLQLASFGFAYVGVAMAFNQGFLVRRLLPKLGEPPLLAMGTLLFSIALLLTGVANAIWVVAIAMTLLALGSGFVNPAVHGSVSLLSKATEQGETMGVVQSLAALARILGPPLGGWIYALYGPSSPFYFGGVMGLFAFVIVLTQFKKLPSAAKVSSSHGPAPLKPGQMGRYQLENIASNELPYVFFNVDAQALAIPEEDRWIFKKLEDVPAETVVAELDKRAADKQYPVLLICKDERLSAKVSENLTKNGYLNVFTVAGGLKGFVAEQPER